MTTLFQELKDAKPDWNVEILGINTIGQESFNGLIAAESGLAWLQDTATNQVWSAWGVTYRDLRILDAQNQLFAVFNLTEHNLAYPTNYATLKALFLEAAQAQDNDKNGLPDAWEMQYFGKLGLAAGADTDGDGLSNFTELAFGLNPARVDATRPIEAKWEAASSRFTVTFRRPAGWLLDFFIETSPDLRQWSPADTTVLSRGSRKNLYDGTGTIQASYSFPRSPADLRPQFVRVRALPRATH